MSNRPRRQWLREQRLRAVVKARIETPPDEFIQTMADWNRWLRSAFRSIERPGLRPDHNLPGEAGKLQTIRIRNKPGRFDLLNGHPDAWPEAWKEINALDRLCRCYEEAVDFFYRARDGLKPMRRVARMRFAWDSWICGRCEQGGPFDDFADVEDPAARYLDQVTDFTAAIYRAARILRCNSLAIHQHAPAQGHATTAARRVLLRGTVTGVRAIEASWTTVPSGRYLNGEAILPESALLRVLALGAAARALEEFRRIAEGVVTDGAAIDLGDCEYAASHLEDAKTWCAEACQIDDAKRETAHLLAAREREEKAARSRDCAHARKHVPSRRSVALPKFFAELRAKNLSFSVKSLFNEALRQVRREAGQGTRFTYTCAGQDYEFSVVMNGDKELLASWVGLQNDGTPDGSLASLVAVQKWREAAKT